MLGSYGSGHYGSTIVIQPSARDLQPEQRAAALAVAERLSVAGLRSWIVGGAARDLARGVAPKDLDMVSAATPDQVEALFERTVAVGKAFGIMVVLIGGTEVELATLRVERGYRDGRRPDEVLFGTSVEDDAARRDFTCNALYLDPLSNEFLDPTGGLADLRAGVLRTVGDPGTRFAEDGLRLLRLARFLALLDLRPAPGLIEAAVGATASLRGVSPERVRTELARIFNGPRPGRAMDALEACAVLPGALPAWAAEKPWPVPARRAALDKLPDPPGEVLGLAWLLEVAPEADAQDLKRDLGLVEALRPARALLARIEYAWRLRRQLPDLLGAPRSARARATREPGWEAGFDLARAWASPELAAELAPLREWREAETEAALFPKALLGPDDLRQAGVPRGPRWGELLAAAETAQLDGEIVDVEQARAWLARREDPS
jgi:tRNA nucleotidyltransferase/poly(A) polymerase